MSRDLTRDELLSLEQILGKKSIGAVLEALSSICEKKAEYINYSDDSRRDKKWSTAAGHIGVLATHPAITKLEHPNR